MNQGIIYALMAYGLWGVTPIYFKLLENTVMPLEIVANRIVWSVLFLVVVISLLAKWKKVKELLQHPSRLKVLLLTTVLIATNWLVFIWAINNDRMLETSLGYYINPLVSICLGYVFLKERHSFAKWFAVTLAALGVCYQVINLGYLPWVSLVLALSFAFYGLLHKKTSTDSLTSLFLETSLLMPLALMYMLWSHHSNGGATRSLEGWLLLMVAGPVTTLPLLFFSKAAKTLSLAAIGFLQYLSPSMIFLLAIFIYKEPFSTEKLMTFLFIWSALVIFSWDSIHTRKKALA